MPDRVRVARVFAFLVWCPITSGLLVSSLAFITARSGNQLGLFRKQGGICLPTMQRILPVGQHVSFVSTPLLHS